MKNKVNLLILLLVLGLFGFGCRDDESSIFDDDLVTSENNQEDTRPLSEKERLNADKKDFEENWNDCKNKSKNCDSALSSLYIIKEDDSDFYNSKLSEVLTTNIAKINSKDYYSANSFVYDREVLYSSAIDGIRLKFVNNNQLEKLKTMALYFVKEANIKRGKRYSVEFSKSFEGKVDSKKELPFPCSFPYEDLEFLSSKEIWQNTKSANEWKLQLADAYMIGWGCENLCDLRKPDYAYKLFKSLDMNEDAKKAKMLEAELLINEAYGLNCIYIENESMIPDEQEKTALIEKAKQALLQLELNEGEVKNLVENWMKKAEQRQVTAGIKRST